MSDIRSYIETKFSDAQTKVAAEIAAEAEAQKQKKEEVPETKEPSAPKSTPSSEWPKVSGKVESSDLRKMASLLAQEREQEDKGSEDVVKVASDLAIQAAALDVEDQRAEIRERWGSIPSSDIEELAKEAEDIASGGQTKTANRFAGVWQAIRAKMPGAQPAKSAWRQQAESIPDAFINAAGDTIKGRAPVYTEGAVGMAEDALLGALKGRNQGSNLGRNVALGVGGAGGLGLAATMGHKAGVKSEQAKDPQQIRAAYGLGWQRRGQFGKVASEEVLSKVAAEEETKEANIHAIVSKVKGMLGSPAGKITGLGLGGAGLAAGGGAVGHQMGVESEQAKDPYQIRSAYSIGAQHGAQQGARYGARMMLQRFMRRQQDAAAPGAPSAPAATKQAQEQPSALKDMFKLGKAMERVKRSFTGSEDAPKSKKYACKDKATMPFRSAGDMSKTANQEQVKEAIIGRIRSAVGGVADKGKQWWSQAREGNRWQAASNRSRVDRNAVNPGSAPQGDQAWRQYARRGGLGGAVDWADRNIPGATAFMDTNPGVAAAMGGLGAAGGVAGATAGAKKALGWAKNRRYQPGFAERVGATVRGQNKARRGQAASNRLAGYGTLGGAGVGAYLLANRN